MSVESVTELSIVLRVHTSLGPATAPGPTLLLWCPLRSRSVLACGLLWSSLVLVCGLLWSRPVSPWSRCGWAWSREDSGRGSGRSQREVSVYDGGKPRTEDLRRATGERSQQFLRRLDQSRKVLSRSRFVMKNHILHRSITQTGLDQGPDQRLDQDYRVHGHSSISGLSGFGV